MRTPAAEAGERYNDKLPTKNSNYVSMDNESQTHMAPEGARKQKLVSKKTECNPQGVDSRRCMQS